MKLTILDLGVLYLNSLRSLIVAIKQVIKSEKPFLPFSYIFDKKNLLFWNSNYAIVSIICISLILI